MDSSKLSSFSNFFFNVSDQERVKDILAIYFKRIDYETSEVVRYSEEDYWKTSKIARFPVFAIKDKIFHC